MTYVSLKNNVRENFARGDHGWNYSKRRAEGEYRWNFDEHYFWVKHMLFDSVFYADFEYQNIFFINVNPAWKNDGHFSKTLFLTTSIYFGFCDPKRAFKKNEKHIFVISSNSSINWYANKIENKFHGKSAFDTPCQKPTLVSVQVLSQGNLAPPRRRTYVSIDLLLVSLMWYVTIFRVLR